MKLEITASSEKGKFKQLIRRIDKEAILQTLARKRISLKGQGLAARRNMDLSIVYGNVPGSLISGFDGA